MYKFSWKLGFWCAIILLIVITCFPNIIVHINNHFKLLSYIFSIIIGCFDGYLFATNNFERIQLNNHIKTSLFKSNDTEKKYYKSIRSHKFKLIEKDEYTKVYKCEKCGLICECSTDHLLTRNGKLLQLDCEEYKVFDILS